MGDVRVGILILNYRATESYLTGYIARAVSCGAFGVGRDVWKPLRFLIDVTRTATRSAAVFVIGVWTTFQHTL